MIPIYENYKDYRPPRHARSSVTKLLSELPSQYLSGLQSVVLTNATAIGDCKTHRVKGKKYPRQTCRGFYHPAASPESCRVSRYSGRFLWQTFFLMRSATI